MTSLLRYSAGPGEYLLVVSCSYVALSFLACCPIVAEARKHPDIALSPQTESCKNHGMERRR